VQVNGNAGRAQGKKHQATAHGHVPCDGIQIQKDAEFRKSSTVRFEAYGAVEAKNKISDRSLSLRQGYLSRYTKRKSPLKKKQNG